MCSRRGRGACTRFKFTVVGVVSVVLVLLSIVATLLNITAVSVVLLQAHGRSVGGGRRRLLHMRFTRLTTSGLSRGLVLLSRRGRGSISIVAGNVHSRLLLSVGRLRATAASTVRSGHVVDTALRTRVGNIQSSVRKRVQNIERSTRLLNEGTRNLRRTLTNNNGSRNV